MNPLANKTASASGVGSASEHQTFGRRIEWFANVLTNLGVLQGDADYHLLRAAMVVMFFFFGYQKWWARPDLPQRGRSHNLCQPTRRKPKPWPANRLRRSPRRRSVAPRRG